MSFVVYDPTSGPAARETAMAPRVASLENGVLGVIDNGKTNSDAVLGRIAENLKESYKIAEVVRVKKRSSSHRVEEELAEDLAERCAFVLAGVGD
jgi:hypothetical protein